MSRCPSLALYAYSPLTFCTRALRRLIYIPHSAAVALYKKIGGTERGSTGEFVVPCASTFSTIALSFGGVQYQMPLSDLFLGYASAASKSECVLGIFGIDQYDAEGNVVAIVGDLFLKVRRALLWVHVLFCAHSPADSCTRAGRLLGLLLLAKRQPSRRVRHLRHFGRHHLFLFLLFRFVILLVSLGQLQWLGFRFGG